METRRPLSLTEMFFVTMVCGIIFYFIVAIFSGGRSFIDSIAICDRPFSDFFESVYDSMKPYEESGVIYPPFINMCYRILAMAITPYAPDAASAVTSVAGATIYAMYVVIATVMVQKIAYTLYPGKRKNLMAFVLILSLPFLYCMFRGNSLAIAAFLIFPFVMWYDSEVKWKRYAAYICLALSANIKMYPIVFGLLILRNRRFMEFAHFILIGLAIFILSSIAINESPADFILNLFNNATEPGGIGFSNLFSAWGLGDNVAMHLTLIVSLAILLFAAVLVIWSDMEEWKIVLMLSLMLCVCGTFNCFYCLVYLFIPITMFFGSNPERNWTNAFYTVCFIIILLPIIGLEVDMEFPVRLAGSISPSYFINGFVPIMLIIFVIATGLYGLRKSRLGRNA